MISPIENGFKLNVETFSGVDSMTTNKQMHHHQQQHLKTNGGGRDDGTTAFFLNGQSPSLDQPSPSSAGIGSDGRASALTTPSSFGGGASDAMVEFLDFDADATNSNRKISNSSTTLLPSQASTGTLKSMYSPNHPTTTEMPIAVTNASPHYASNSNWLSSSPWPSSPSAFDAPTLQVQANGSCHVKLPADAGLRSGQEPWLLHNLSDVIVTVVDKSGRVVDMNCHLHNFEDLRPEILSSIQSRWDQLVVGIDRSIWTKYSTDVTSELDRWVAGLCQQASNTASFNHHHRRLLLECPIYRIHLAKRGFYLLTLSLPIVRPMPPATPPTVMNDGSSSTRVTLEPLILHYHCLIRECRSRKELTCASASTSFRRLSATKSNNQSSGSTPLSSPTKSVAATMLGGGGGGGQSSPNQPQMTTNHQPRVNINHTPGQLMSSYNHSAPTCTPSTSIKTVSYPSSYAVSNNISVRSGNSPPLSLSTNTQPSIGLLPTTTVAYYNNTNHDPIAVQATADYHQRTSTSVRSAATSVLAPTTTTAATAPISLQQLKTPDSSSSSSLSLLSPLPLDQPPPGLNGLDCSGSHQQPQPAYYCYAAAVSTSPSSQQFYHPSTSFQPCVKPVATGSSTFAPPPNPYYCETAVTGRRSTGQNTCSYQRHILPCTVASSGSATGPHTKSSVCGGSTTSDNQRDSRLVQLQKNLPPQAIDKIRQIWQETHRGVDNRDLAEPARDDFARRVRQVVMEYLGPKALVDGTSSLEHQLIVPLASVDSISVSPPRATPCSREKQKSGRKSRDPVLLPSPTNTFIVNSYPMTSTATIKYRNHQSQKVKSPPPLPSTANPIQQTSPSSMSTLGITPNNISGSLLQPSLTSPKRPSTGSNSTQQCCMLEWLLSEEADLCLLPDTFYEDVKASSSLYATDGGPGDSVFDSPCSLPPMTASNTSTSASSLLPVAPLSTAVSSSSSSNAACSTNILTSLLSAGSSTGVVSAAPPVPTPSPTAPPPRSDSLLVLSSSKTVIDQIVATTSDRTSSSSLLATGAGKRRFSGPPSGSPLPTSQRPRTASSSSSHPTPTGDNRSTTQPYRPPASSNAACMSLTQLLLEGSNDVGGPSTPSHSPVMLDDASQLVNSHTLSPSIVDSRHRPIPSTRDDAVPYSGLTSSSIQPPLSYDKGIYSSQVAGGVVNNIITASPAVVSTPPPSTSSSTLCRLLLVDPPLPVSVASATNNQSPSSFAGRTAPQLVSNKTSVTDRMTTNAQPTPSANVTNSSATADRQSTFDYNPQPPLPESSTNSTLTNSTTTASSNSSVGAKDNIVVVDDEVDMLCQVLQEDEMERSAVSGSTSESPALVICGRSRINSAPDGVSTMTPGFVGSTSSSSTTLSPRCQSTDNAAAAVALISKQLQQGLTATSTTNPSDASNMQSPQNVHPTTALSSSIPADNLPLPVSSGINQSSSSPNTLPSSIQQHSPAMAAALAASATAASQRNRLPLQANLVEHRKRLLQQQMYNQVTVFSNDNPLCCQSGGGGGGSGAIQNAGGETDFLSNNTKQFLLPSSTIAQSSQLITTPNCPAVADRQSRSVELSCTTAVMCNQSVAVASTLLAPSSAPPVYPMVSPSYYYTVLPEDLNSCLRQVGPNVRVELHQSSRRDSTSSEDGHQHLPMAPPPTPTSRQQPNSAGPFTSNTNGYTFTGPASLPSPSTFHSATPPTANELASPPSTNKPVRAVLRRKVIDRSSSSGHSTNTSPSTSPLTVCTNLPLLASPQQSMIKRRRRQHSANSSGGKPISETSCVVDDPYAFDMGPDSDSPPLLPTRLLHRSLSVSSRSVPEQPTPPVSCQEANVVFYPSTNKSNPSSVGVDDKHEGSNADNGSVAASPAVIFNVNNPLGDCNSEAVSIADGVNVLTSLPVVNPNPSSGCDNPEPCHELVSIVSDDLITNALSSPSSLAKIHDSSVYDNQLESMLVADDGSGTNPSSANQMNESLILDDILDYMLHLESLVDADGNLIVARHPYTPELSQRRDGEAGPRQQSVDLDENSGLVCATAATSPVKSAIPLKPHESLEQQLDTPPPIT